ncbi:HAD hydrolase [Macleaya cordata]|uniref:HAD hydrolase n=1 Tax=Macleaya cordata TaxID=56857 RepID=A0A200Q5F3_MACCD|nr:HAD hydrolase [Macleaya cordata]
MLPSGFHMQDASDAEHVYFIGLLLFRLIIRSISSLAPLEAILFDIDGTLCDSDPLHFYAFREMLQEVGFNGGVPIDENFFIEKISGKHNDEIARILFPDWELQKGLKFTDDKEAYFRRLASEKLKPVKGLDKLRKWVEDHGFKRAAVTNAPRPNADLMVSSLGLSDFFESVVIGGECERAKPFPDPYLKGLQVLKASPSHTLVFEDSVSGIKAGVAAGMPVVALTTGNPEHLLMEAGASLIIKDFEDPKLWTALEELEGEAAKASVAN